MNKVKKLTVGALVIVAIGFGVHRGIDWTSKRLDEQMVSAEKTTCLGAMKEKAQDLATTYGAKWNFTGEVALNQTSQTGSVGEGYYCSATLHFSVNGADSSSTWYVIGDRAAPAEVQQGDFFGLGIGRQNGDVPVGTDLAVIIGLRKILTQAVPVDFETFSIDEMLSLGKQANPPNIGCNATIAGRAVSAGIHDVDQGDEFSAERNGQNDWQIEPLKMLVGKSGSSPEDLARKVRLCVAALTTAEKQGVAQTSSWQKFSKN